MMKLLLMTSLSVLTPAFALFNRTKLPRDNELGNSCYFTYRMNFIICDQGLDPQTAKEEIAKGRCHQDYRVMGSDFQSISNGYYNQERLPPLEEAFWLLGLPEHFQSQTMTECPAIMVISYLMIAESDNLLI